MLINSYFRFRWVACQLDYLCEFNTDSDRIKALEQLPPTLPDSYQRILQRVNSRPAKTQRMVQLCLQFIAFFPKQLSILELCQAVSVPEEIGEQLQNDNTVDEGYIVLNCSSLIRKSADGKSFEFAHFSVREFLEDKSLSLIPGLEQYLVSRSKSTSLLALQCLRFLQLGNIDFPISDRKGFLEKQRELDSELPFYRHAATYWPMFTRDGFYKSDAQLLREAAEALFNEFRSSKFCCWVYWFVAALYETVFHENPINNGVHFSIMECHVAADIALDEQLQPLHLASALNIPEICSFLIEGDADIKALCQLGSSIVLAQISLLDAITPIGGVRLANSGVFSLLLSTTERRTATIKCLLDHGAKLSDLYTNPSVFSNMVIISCHLHDFDPVIEILSNGILPTPSDIKLFGSYLSQWGPYCNNRKKFESTLRQLNKYLRETSAFDTEWGFNFGSTLWAKAVAMELPFTRDTALTNSRISLSQDALREKIMLAVINDKSEALSSYLDDGRVCLSDSWTWNSSPSQTLLHHATKLNACTCVKFLLEKGSDPYARNDDGMPVLHGIDMKEDGSILNVFLERNLSLIDADTKQWTIWHVCASKADSSASFIDKLFNANPKETEAAVLMRTRQGNSPLMQALSKSPGPHCERELLEDHALSFIAYCDHVPRFWETHDPILPTAFRFGSQKVIQRLSDLGIRPKTYLPGDVTPLHELSAEASQSWVQFVISILPGAIGSRYLDRLPLEAYLDTCIRSGALPDEKVANMLSSNEVLRSEDMTGSTPWDFACYAIDRLLRWVRNNDSSPNSVNSLDLVWRTYLSLDAMTVYEDISRQCGPGQLLSALVGVHRREDGAIFVSALSHATLEQAILSSQLWNPSRDDTVRFLMMTIESRRVDLVRTLLQHRVSVHQRVNDITAIEFACEGNLATELCSTNEGRAILQLVLDHSDGQKLREFAPGSTGQGLLHMIACSGQEPQVRWLIEELVRRGVDINGINTQADVRFRSSPLIYHIFSGSTCYATYLLDMGADPTLVASTTGNVSYFDAVSCAAFFGDISFLHKLLTSSQETGIEVPWNRKIFYPWPYGKGSSTLEVSNLHIACYRGFLEIVKFFVEKKLINCDIMTKDSIGPLHMAALGGQPDVIEYLAIQSQVQTVDIMTRNRVTPLHFAALNGHLEAIKTLVRLGARGSIAVSSWTPRSAASNVGHQSIVDFLDREGLSHDESVSERILVHRHQVNLRHQMGAAILSGNLEDCHNAASAGCPLDDSIPYSNGCNPFCLALSNGQLDIAMLFLNYKVTTLTRCYATGGWGLGPIEVAALDTRSFEILSLLIDRYIENGGDLINGRDSPIFYAAKENEEGMRILLEYIAKDVYKRGYGP